MPSQRQRELWESERAASGHSEEGLRLAYFLAQRSLKYMKINTELRIQATWKVNLGTDFGKKAWMK